MITNQVVEVSYNGTGAETEFVITFDYQLEAQVKAYIIDTTATPDTITEILQGAGASKFTIIAGPKVKFGTAPLATDIVVIRRSSALTQPVDYNENNAFPFADHEEQMDKMVQIVQESSNEISKKIGLAEASQTTTPTFPEPVSEGIIRWNAAMDGLEAIPNEDLGLTASDIANVPAGTIAATDVQAAIDELNTDAEAHLADFNNPHVVAAFQVPTVPAGNLSAVEVQSALNELQSDVDTRTLETDFQTHLDSGVNTHSQIDAHIVNTTNPHNVTAAQVGKDTAQWNADKIKDVPVDLTGISDGASIAYNQAEDKFVITTEMPAAKVDKLGDTMTGPLVFDGTAYLQLDPDGAAPAHSEGALFYDPTAHTPAYYDQFSDVKHNIRGDGPIVYNDTGATIPDGAMVKLGEGGPADFPSVALANANASVADESANGQYGIATHDIVHTGAKRGVVAIQGAIVNTNTITLETASGETGTWIDGDVLYANPAVPGYYTKTRPAEPHHIIVAAQLISHGVNGKLYVICQHSNAVNKKYKYNGIEDNSLVTLAYQADTREVTVTHAAGSAIWVSGVRYAKSGTEVVAHDTTNGKHYFYWDATGTLVANTTPWNLLITASVALVYYKHNATPALAKGLLFDERHPGGESGFDEEDHRYKHLFLGTQLRGTPTISGLTKGAGGNLPYAINSVFLEDEDLITTVTAQADWDSDSNARYPQLWVDSASGTWDWDFTTSTNGITTSAGAIVYNDVSTGVLTALTDSRFCNYWPFAVPILGYSLGSAFTAYTGFMYIIGQSNVANFAAASAITPQNLLYISNLTEEGVVFARITYQRIGGANNVYNDTANPTYFKGNLISLGSTSFSPTNHSSLSNRTDANSHPASAISVDGTNLDKQLTGVADALTALETLDEGATYIKSEASDPSGAEGKVYFNSTTKKFLGYNGTVWGEIGGGKFQANTVTSDTFTLTDNGLQKWVHDGLAADVITEIVLSSVTDGSMVIVVGSSDSNPLTIPATATGITKQNGDMELGLGNTITYLYDSTVGLIETSRT